MPPCPEQCAQVPGAIQLVRSQGVLSNRKCRSGVNAPAQVRDQPRVCAMLVAWALASFAAMIIAVLQPWVEPELRCLETLTARARRREKAFVSTGPIRSRQRT